jgi:uncharacterized protein YcfJ
MTFLSRTPHTLGPILRSGWYRIGDRKAGLAKLGLGALVVVCLLAPTAQAAGVYDEARVVNVEPLYERVSYSVPLEVCREEQVSYQTQRRRGGVTAPILGAVIGGAIGNAVGHHKRNRQVGTVVGAVLGGSIGADIARNRRAPEGATHYRNEQVCHTEREVREEERADGFRVTYAYAGQTHTTKMNRDPGPTLRVRVNVTPAG